MVMYNLYFQSPIAIKARIYEVRAFWSGYVFIKQKKTTF